MPGIGGGVVFGGGGGGALLALSTQRFLKGTASGAALAAVIAPPGWTVTLLADFGGRVTLSSRQITAAQLLAAVASGTIKLRAASTDGREAVEKTFEVSVYEDVTTPPDVTAPTITSPSAFSVAEGTALVIQLTANEPVVWTKVGGTDAAAFTLDPQTARLTLAAKDFDVPSDSDGNNTFGVQIRATDAAGNASNQSISAAITNLLDTPRTPLTAATVAMAFNVAAGTQIFDLQALVEGEARAVSLAWLVADAATGDVNRSGSAGPPRSTVEQQFDVDITTTQGGVNPVTVRFKVVVPAAGLAPVPIGAVMGAIGDGIVSEGSAPGLRNMWGIFERRLGLRMQPAPVSLIARSGTTISRTLGPNTPWINPTAIDALAAQKLDVPFFLTCGANDNVLSTDPVADPTSLNDWKAAVSYFVASNPQALRLPVMTTWPSGKTGEATHRTNVLNAQKAHLASLDDPRIVLIDTASIVPAEVANDSGLVHPHEIGADKGAQLIMAAIEPHLAPATKAQILDMIHVTATYPKMGVQRDPDRALAATGSGTVTAPVTGTVPSSKVISTTTGSSGIVASLADTTGGRKKQVIRAGGSGSAAGIVKYEDKTALPLALTPGQYALSGMGLKLPRGYSSFGVELGSIGQTGTYQAANNTGLTGPVAYDLDTIVIARPSQPSSSVATAKKTSSARYPLGALPETDIEIEQPFAWVINDRTRHRPAHLGNVSVPLTISGTLTNQAGALRINPGSFVPAGLTEADYVERRIYRGGDATLGSGALIATMSGSTWTWAAAGLAAGDLLWAEIDANNGVGLTRTVRSATGYLVP